MAGFGNKRLFKEVTSDSQPPSKRQKCSSCGLNGGHICVIDSSTSPNDGEIEIKEVGSPSRYFVQISDVGQSKNEDEEYSIFYIL